MDKSPESMPFNEVEELCRLTGVEYNTYDLGGSLNQVITSLRVRRTPSEFFKEGAEAMRSQLAASVMAAKGDTSTAIAILQAPIPRFNLSEKQEI